MSGLWSGSGYMHMLTSSRSCNTKITHGSESLLPPCNRLWERLPELCSPARRGESPGQNPGVCLSVSQLQKSQEPPVAREGGRQAGRKELMQSSQEQQLCCPSCTNPSTEPAQAFQCSESEQHLCTLSYWTQL